MSSNLNPTGGRERISHCHTFALPNDIATWIKDGRKYFKEINKMDLPSVALMMTSFRNAFEKNPQHLEEYKVLSGEGLELHDQQMMKKSKSRL